MGLDMNAYTRAGTFASPVDFDSEDTDREIAYWRKHPNLHGWMENLYRAKGGKAESFNCVNVEVTSEDLDELELAVKNNTLPATSGFFFGQSRPEDLVDDFKFIMDARAAIAAGERVYYSSWW